MKRLQAEIKPGKPFESLEQEAYLNLLRTADALFRRQEALLRTVGFSPVQYNVLRILRGAEPEGLACRDIGERMLTRDPDITRLLDRLEQRKLVRRLRVPSDRRVIMTRITPMALQLLNQLDSPMASLLKEALGHLGKRRLQSLVDLLQVARSRS
jgi:DNA-binding MarR family transcriptional regulator